MPIADAAVQGKLSALTADMTSSDSAEASFTIVSISSWLSEVQGLNIFVSEQQDAFRHGQLPLQLSRIG